MKNKLGIFVVLTLVAFAFTSCGPSTETDICEYDGYHIMSISAEDSDCGCGKIYKLHLRNEHNFKDVRVNEGAWRYYTALAEKANKDSTTVSINCKEMVELQDE